jgi:diguanylate cyclase (GGDEF)-like protein/PAS domain S-box-containing protein
MAGLEDNAFLQAEIGQHKQAEVALCQSDINLLTLIDHIQAAVWSVDASYVLMALNSAFKQHVSLAFEVELSPGMSAVNCLPSEQQRLWIDYYDRALKGDRFCIEQHYLLNGVSIYVDVVFNPIIDNNGQITGVAVFSRDITQRKQTETQLLHDAFHDRLTGLPNHTLFLDRLTHAVELAQRQNYLFAVLFLDLDHFKAINDSLGHIAGDQLLRQLAHELENCLRLGDTISRFGGDEFTVLLEAIHDKNDAVLVVERIKQRLAQPFKLDGREIYISASIGIALSSSDYDQPEDLVRYADLAMYRAKAFDSTCYEVFEP